MELKIKIQTPKGQATGTEKKFRPFIIGSKKKIHKTYVSPEDDIIIWDVNASIKETMRITKNLAMFDRFIHKTLDSKVMKKTLRKKLTPEGEKELTEMLMNHTNIEIIKKATAEEIVENNKTWWQKMKEKFKRIDEDE